MNHRGASFTLIRIIEEFFFVFVFPCVFLFYTFFYTSLRSLFHIDMNHRGAPFMQMSNIEELLSH